MIDFPNKKYKIIYADPPWDYGNTKNLKGKFWGIAEKHYKTMKFSEILSLPVNSISDKDAYLFLWTTSPFLKHSFEVIEKWGFKYSTVGFVWVKMKNDMSDFRRDGLGKYTISNAEYCLIGRNGKYFRNSKSVQQIIKTPKLGHSKKPDEIRKRIIDLVGDVSRIELFAREKAKGWDAW